MSKAKVIPALNPQSFEARALYCRAFLAIHGFLTDAENRKVSERMEKRIGTKLKASQRGMIAAAFVGEVGR